MENEFLPYKLAVEMKSIGFDEPCLGYYANKTTKTIRLALWTNIGYVNENRLDDDIVTAPIYRQVFKWFRDKHNLHSWITSKTTEKEDVIYIPHGRTLPDTIKLKLVVDIIPYSTYNSNEEAELECLKKLIEILKNK